MAQDPSQLVFSLNKSYRLKNDGSRVTLDVIIGSVGQNPDITVKLNTKKLLEHEKNTIRNLFIDTDESLPGKVLKVSGCVVDTSSDTNKIEVTLKVKGGIEDLTKKFTVTVDEDGEQVDLSFIIRF